MLWLKRLFVVLLLSTLAWQLLRVAFPQQESTFRSHVRASFENLFPQQAKQAQQRFGLKHLFSAARDKPEIMLVHGLDDPGKVWMNLAPVLGGDGYGVTLFEYPNDQPIRQSAKLLQQALMQLAREDVSHINIVAHSMGGLVSREALTSPSLICPPLECAAVEQLIMVGTPNHGSQLARFRGLGEVREQVSRLISGKAGWLDWVFDGAGEAGIDLVPDSEFLQALNARPHAHTTKMTVVAGIIGKDQWESLQLLLNNPIFFNENPLSTFGDFLVTVESARLEGVAFYQVSGNHLSIIRNLTESSERMPPAIPVIRRLLKD